MPWETLEMKPFHFLVSVIRRPAILSHAVHRRHHTGAMTATLAVDIDRPIRRVIHKLQKLSYCGFGWRFGCRQRNTIKLHSGALYKPGLIGPAAARQVNNSLHAKSSEVGVVATVGLSSAVVMLVSLAEVLDADFRRTCVYRCLSRCRGGHQQGGRQHRRKIAYAIQVKH